MVTIKFFQLVTSAIFCCLFNVCVYADNPVVFTQLTSLQNQPALSPINLASLEKVDGIENIGNALTHITINKAGYYFIIAVGQAGVVKQGASGNQYLDIWLIKNGVPIANSTNRITVSEFLTGTVVTQNIVGLHANDTVSVGFTASDPSFGLIATPAKGQEPAIASLVFSIYRL